MQKSYRKVFSQFVFCSHYRWKTYVILLFEGEEGDTFWDFFLFFQKGSIFFHEFPQINFCYYCGDHKKLYGLLPSLCKAILGYFRAHFGSLSSFPCLERLKIFSWGFAQIFLVLLRWQPSKKFPWFFLYLGHFEVNLVRA